MPTSEDYPLDQLVDCAEKAAFLTDAIAALADGQQRTDLSQRGLHGLWRYLSDLEQSLIRIANQQEV